jgi:hypothetical protein
MSAPDLTVVMQAVDFGGVLQALVSVAAAVMVVYVLRKAINIVQQSITGGGLATPRWESDVIDEANDRALRGESVNFSRMMSKAAIRQQRFF